MGCAGRGKLSAVCGERGMGTWDGGGARGGVRGSGGVGDGNWRLGTRIGGARNGRCGAVRGGRGTRTWDGGGACGIAQRSAGASGGGQGWKTRTGGAKNGKRSAVRVGRRTWSLNGDDLRVGAPGSRGGGSGAPGGHGGALASRSSGSERVRRGGAVGSVRAEGGCTSQGESGGAAVCGTAPRRGADRASQETSVEPGGLRVVPPSFSWGGKSPTLRGSAA